MGFPVVVRMSLGPTAFVRPIWQISFNQNFSCKKDVLIEHNAVKILTRALLNKNSV
jgi:hypothetical protein